MPLSCERDVIVVILMVVVRGKFVAHVGQPPMLTDAGGDSTRFSARITPDHAWRK